MVSLGCVIKEGGLFQEPPYSDTVLVIHQGKQSDKGNFTKKEATKQYRQASCMVERYQERKQKRSLGLQSR